MTFITYYHFNYYYYKVIAYYFFQQKFSPTLHLTQTMLALLQTADVQPAAVPQSSNRTFY